VSLGIVNVLRPATVGNVVNAVIRWIAVKVPSVKTLWPWANKGKRNGGVNKKNFGCTVLSRIKSRVAVLVARSFHDAATHFHGVSIIHRNPSFAADTPDTADAVKTFVTGYRQPSFIRKVGHADATYCLNVADNHTFFAGCGQGQTVVSNCDDVHNVNEGESQTMRENTVRWFNEVVPSRLNDFYNSSKIVIMQRVHEDDVSGDILKRGLDYVHLCVPMRYDSARHCETPIWSDWRTEDGQLAWPERMDESVVDELEHTLGPYAFSSQYQQRPTPRGGGIIKDKWWNVWDEDYAIRLGLQNQGDVLKFPAFEFVVASLDTAFNKGQEIDYHALAVMGVWRDENDLPKIMVTDCWQKRLTLHGDMPERKADESDLEYLRRNKKSWGLVEHVIDICKRRKVDALLIEDSAKGRDVAEELFRLFKDELFSIQLVNATKDKVSRTYAVVPIFSGGLLYCPDREWAQEMIDEMANFPKVTHDDRHDAVVQGLKYLRDTGWALRRDERDRVLERRTMLENVIEPAPLYDV
jgi:predicted phage terminase large subunit-like protein